jgi:hypothetical protein
MSARVFGFGGGGAVFQLFQTEPQFVLGGKR